MTKNIQTNELVEMLGPCLILSYKTQGSDILCLETKERSITPAHTHTRFFFFWSALQTVIRGTFVQTKWEQRAGGTQSCAPAKRQEKRTKGLLFLEKEQINNEKRKKKNAFVIQPHESIGRMKVFFTFEPTVLTWHDKRIDLEITSSHLIKLLEVRKSCPLLIIISCQLWVRENS